MLNSNMRLRVLSRTHERIANLPANAQAIFGKPQNTKERVRTLKVRIDFSEEMLRRFAPLAPSAKETKERLDWLTGEWTNAMQWLLDRIRIDLFEDRRDTLISVAAQRVYDDADEARSKGRLQPLKENGRSVEIDLGTKERPLRSPVLCYGKRDKKVVRIPEAEQVGKEVKTKYCAEVGGVFIALLPENNSQTIFRPAGFDAQAFGGFISAAYISENLNKKKQEEGYSFGEVGTTYVRENKDRLRMHWLKKELSSSANEPIRQKVAETVCGFLEEYFSVRPEIKKTAQRHRVGIDEARECFLIAGPGFSDFAKRRLHGWQKAADAFRLCDPSDPADVDRYRDWVVEYNTRLNELWQEMTEASQGQKELKDFKLDDIKGYPSFPSYKNNAARSFADALSGLKQLFGTAHFANVEAIRTWVDDTYLDGEIRRRDYVGRHNRKSGKRSAMPLRKRIAREVFGRTGGKLKLSESGWESSWDSGPKRLAEVWSAIVAKLLAQGARLENHARSIPGDFAARRQLVDVWNTLVNLSVTGMKSRKRIEVLAEANRLAGEAKGALLHLAEGEKTEFQISGLSLTFARDGWKLGKNACRLVAGKPLAEGEKLALCVDYSSGREKPLAISTSGKNADSGIRAIGFSGGNKKKDAKDEQKERTLRVGAPDGPLGSYGLVLPLQFGSSQARRYLYPKNGHPEDGMVGALAQSINIRSARIVRENESAGEVAYYAHLAVETPGPVFDTSSVDPSEFIGVDRGETSLAVFARTDRDGKLIAEPELYGKGMVRAVARNYRRVRQSQSQAKRLEGGKWFEGMINNEVRNIAIKAVAEMLLHRAAIALEYLERGFARGGTASWEHQYTKVADELVDVLRFCGLPISRDGTLYAFGPKAKQVWYGSVHPAYTSQTCPSCGAIWTKPEKLENKKNGVPIVVYGNTIDDQIGTAELREKDGRWSLTWPGGKSVPIMAPRFDKHIRAFLAAANAKVRDKAARPVLELLKHRTRDDYETFSCHRCGIRLHADKVGALNIARRAMWQMQRTKDLPDKDARRADWQQWYKRHLKKDGWWNENAAEWLKR